MSKISDLNLRQIDFVTAEIIVEWLKENGFKDASEALELQIE